MGIKPLLDRVVVVPNKSEEKTAGGIILPGNEKKTSTEGKVVAVGPGVRNEDGSFSPLSITVGDTVVYTQYGGTEIKLEGKDYLVLSESAILGIIQ